MKNQKLSTRYLTVCGMFTAVAFIAVLLSKAIPNVAGFLSYEPKDAVIVIAGFIFGPLTCVFVSVLTSLIEMLTISTTGPYGFLMVLWNYIITPFYMGVDRSVVAGMLASVFLPFNLVKGGLNAAITLLLYKPIVTALRKAKLVEPGSGKKGRFSLGFTLFALAVLATFVMLLLVMLGVL